MGLREKVVGWVLPPKEEEMAKKTVKFNVKDGSKPVKHGCVLGLRAPLRLNLGARTSVVISLGVSCADHPLVIFEYADLKKRGVALVSSGVVCDSGTDLTVTLENRGDSVVLIERGDTVARAAVLDNSDFTVE
jgi:dUTPase